MTMTGEKALIDVEPRDLGLPPEEFMDSDDGIPENFLYTDARGWRTDDFRRVAKAEDEILTYIEAGGDVESDEALDRFEDNEAWATSIDPGLIGTVLALSVVGCCPITSCVGGDGHMEDHPLVMFWCPEEAWEVVRDSAIETGVSICAVKLDGPQPALMAFHTSDWRPLQSFGIALVQRWPDTGSYFGS